MGLDKLHFSEDEVSAWRGKFKILEKKTKDDLESERKLRDDVQKKLDAIEKFKKGGSFGRAMPGKAPALGAQTRN